jgi:hypothetical protein
MSRMGETEESENLKGSEHLEELGVDGKLII